MLAKTPWRRFLTWGLLTWGCLGSGALVYACAENTSGSCDETSTCPPASEAGSDAPVDVVTADGGAEATEVGADAANSTGIARTPRRRSSSELKSPLPGSGIAREWRPRCPGPLRRSTPTLSPRRTARL